MRSDASGMIVDVVRGAKSIASLADAGIMITMTPDACDIHNTKGVVATATYRDVALGLAAYRHDPQAAREWACVLLAGSTFLSLDFDTEPDGDELLGMLWDMSFGEPIEDQRWTLVGKVIARSDQSHHP